MDELTMDDLKEIFANPFYAISIHPNLAGLHKTLISADEWVKVNIRAILETDDGQKLDYDPRVEQYLSDFLYKLLLVLSEGKTPVGYTVQE